MAQIPAQRQIGRPEFAGVPFSGGRQAQCSVVSIGPEAAHFTNAGFKQVDGEGPIFVIQIKDLLVTGREIQRVLADW